MNQPFSLNPIHHLTAIGHRDRSGSSRVQKSPEAGCLLPVLSIPAPRANDRLRLIVQQPALSNLAFAEPSGEKLGNRDVGLKSRWSRRLPYLSA
jgi:hypothetical protein